jgi:hypothetical protein
MRLSRRAKLGLILCGILAFAGLLALAVLPLGGPKAESWRWLGRFHVVLVHFPVGLLLVAPLLELAGRRWPPSRTAGLIVLALGAVGAYAAVFAGLALAHADGHAGAGVDRHLWGGMVVTALATGACLLWICGWNRAYTVTLFITFGTLGWTAHQGGSLVHGEYYLTEGLPERLRKVLNLPNPPEPETYSTDTVFGAGVQPMLKRNCVACHGPTKQKGNYRVDNFTALARGGQSGRTALVPHDPEHSELLRRLVLPQSDGKAMPPHGQPRPVEAEVRLLEWWIAQGARPMMTLAQGVESDPAFAGIFTDALTPEPVRIELPKVGDYTRITDQLATLASELHVTIQPISKRPGDGLLLLAIGGTLNEDVFRLLAPLSPYLVEANLGGSNVNDAALAELDSFRNLEKLNLSGTKVTGIGLRALITLPRLTHVNVCETPVDDDGLLVLLQLDSLKAVYTAGSKVTDPGRAEFRRRRPNCSVP